MYAKDWRKLAWATFLGTFPILLVAWSTFLGNFPIFLLHQFCGALTKTCLLECPTMFPIKSKF